MSAGKEHKTPQAERPTLTYEQEVHAVLCASAANTEDLLRYFEAQAAQESKDAKKLTEKCIEWKRDDLRRIRALIPQALERREARAVAPVETPPNRFSVYPWLNEVCKKSGWNVGRFVQFVEEYGHMEALADTLLAWKSENTPAVHPRLTAEQFYQDGYEGVLPSDYMKLNPATIIEFACAFAEAFRDKSEAGLLNALERLYQWCPSLEGHPNREEYEADLDSAAKIIMGVQNYGRGEAAESEQNKAGLSASSGVSFITSSALNERPESEAELREEIERLRGGRR